MALDAETIMAQGQAVTAEALSEHQLLLNSFQGVDLGPTQVPFFVQVTEDFAGPTAVEIQIVGANAEDFSDKFVIESSGDIPLAELVAGYVYKGTVNHHNHCKYIAFNFVPVGGAATAGKVNAAFSLYNTKHAGHYQSAGEIQINSET